MHLIETTGKAKIRFYYKYYPDTEVIKTCTLDLYYILVRMLLNVDLKTKYG